MPTETPEQRAARVQQDLADYRAQPLPDDYLRAVAYDMAAMVRRLYAENTALQTSLTDAMQALTRAQSGATVARQGDGAGGGAAAAAEKPELPKTLVQPKMGV